MHLVAKTVKGREYYYLVEKGRRDGRVVTTRTIYIGDWRKLADLVQQSAASVLPTSFAAQPVGAALALATIAKELGIEELIDGVCPLRARAAPVGRRIVLAAIHRLLAPRGKNAICNLAGMYEGSVLADLLPVAEGALDDRRMGELLGSISSKQVERIETLVVERLVQREGVRTEALAFDCTNFDSFAGAKSRSRLLRRGHSKSGRSLRVLGLGLLATSDGMPLLTFAYPGNENDVTSFARFLKALDRRRASLDLPLEATVAADGGNISKQLLLRLERKTRHYVMRLPPRHLGELQRRKRTELTPLQGSLKGKVWADKEVRQVYGADRWVIDTYSKRMHERQLPGLNRDRAHARAALKNLQRLLEKQRLGKRHAKPLTVEAVQRRVGLAQQREHMKTLFQVQVAAGDLAPTLTFVESTQELQRLDEYVLGRSLLVTNRADWTPQQAVLASRVQSSNENIFRDLKDPGGASMLPLRHRKDATLRAHALVVVLGLMLARVLQRRVQKAGVKAPSLKSVIDPLKGVARARMHLADDAPAALRALSESTWVPSARDARQAELLGALDLADRPELGTTLKSRLSAENKRVRGKRAA